MAFTGRRDLEKSIELFKVWKRDRVPVMDRHDAQSSPDFITWILLCEIFEAQDEWFKGNASLEAMELVDVLVIYVSFIKALNSSKLAVEVAHHPITLDGAGRSENYYETLIEVAGNVVAEGMNDKASVHFLSLLIARLKLVLAEKTLLRKSREVRKKNEDNYYYEYLDVYDEHGNLLPPELIDLKYFHVVPMLKKLRKTYGSPLEMWMHKPFEKLIKNFHNKNGLIDLEKAIGELNLAMHMWYREKRRDLTPTQLKMLKVAQKYGIENHDGTLRSSVLQQILIHVSGAKKITIKPGNRGVYVN